MVSPCRSGLGRCLQWHELYLTSTPTRTHLEHRLSGARYNYIGIKHLVTQGCIFDREPLYDRFPNELLPFDYDEYFRHADGFENGSHGLCVGPSCLFKGDSRPAMACDIVKASSSLPYVSKIVWVDGRPLLTAESSTPYP